VALDGVWTRDITYIDTAEGWLHLTVMLDLFSRRIVGWALPQRMTQQLVVDALRMAWFRRQPQAGLIIYIDRGSQYCSAALQRALKAYGMRSSMSRKGNC
jgi:putative transposase